jgi:hypothetical protein
MKYSSPRIFLFVVLFSTLVLAGPSGYHVTTTYQIGGDGSWDYLTLDGASRHLLYLARNPRDRH